MATLNLSSNEFAFIPSSIRRLKRLKEFNLSRNKFTVLPYVMENMSINQLDLSDCPLLSTDVEYALRSTESSDGKMPATLFQLAAQCVLRKR